MAPRMEVDRPCACVGYEGWPWRNGKKRTMTNRSARIVATSAAMCTLLTASLLAVTPAIAATPTSDAVASSLLADGAPEDAPMYDAAVAAPGPDDLTWEEAAEVSTDSSVTFTDSSASTANVARANTPIAAASGQACSINTGNVYKRASGGEFPYGAVGGHPATQCTVIMAQISQTTDLYKTVWWGLQKVAGPFTSVNVGQGRLEQTSPIRKCDDLRQTTFRMIVRSTGTFPTGTTGTASAYEEANLACGTN